ncbi:MAG: caspase family protein [Candidatus Acidiferrum sp.]
MWLEIPEQQIYVEPNGSKVLSLKEISYLLLHIYASSSQVNYGSIHAKINAEAANVIMTVKGTSEGILCNLDLKRRPGFEIKPGRDSVEIEFTDSHQRIHYASFLLQVPESTEAEQPAVPKAPPVRLTGDKYAVVVGISKYEHQGAGLSNLKYADRDARDFLAFLESPAGGSFRKENIRALFNEEATTQNVQTALRTFLAKPGETDTVILYWAGHGDEDPNDNRNLYLLTYDTDPDNMGGTAYLMSDLPTVFRRVLKAKHVITFTDSCHSYGITGERAHVSSMENKENNLINQYMEVYAKEGDRAVFTASDISQTSDEDERWGGGHGVFTYFLLEGLRGAADANHDGTVTAGELYAYVKKQVLIATGRAQNPQAILGSAENIPLSGPLVRSQTSLPAQLFAK